MTDAMDNDELLELFDDTLAEARELFLETLGQRVSATLPVEQLPATQRDAQLAEALATAPAPVAMDAGTVCPGAVPDVLPGDGIVRLDVQLTGGAALPEAQRAMLPLTHAELEHVAGELEAIAAKHARHAQLGVRDWNRADVATELLQLLVDYFGWPAAEAPGVGAVE